MRLHLDGDVEVLDDGIYAKGDTAYGEVSRGGPVRGGIGRDPSRADVMRTTNISPTETSCSRAGRRYPWSANWPMLAGSAERTTGPSRWSVDTAISLALVSHKPGGQRAPRSRRASHSRLRRWLRRGFRLGAPWPDLYPVDPTRSRALTGGEMQSRLAGRTVYGKADQDGRHYGGRTDDYHILCTSRWLVAAAGGLLER